VRPTAKLVRMATVNPLDFVAVHIRIYAALHQRARVMSEAHLVRSLEEGSLIERNAYFATRRMSLLFPRILMVCGL
jgi:hypothetical protein